MELNNVLKSLSVTVENIMRLVFTLPPIFIYWSTIIHVEKLMRSFFGVNLNDKGLKKWRFISAADTTVGSVGRDC